MAKTSSSDLLSILRKFEVAGDENVPRQIEQIKFTHPAEHVLLAAFRFGGQQYFAVYDNTAEDQASYIEELVAPEANNKPLELLENPNSDHLATYGMPFKGKDVYLARIVSAKKRLDIALTERYPELSRSTWQKHIKAGHVSVNGTVQTSTRYDVAETDQIAANLPDATDFSASDLPVIYMDDNVIVVNKPVGVLTHSKGALNDEFTVADFFRRYTTFGLATDRPGIVHRLDRDTSGVIIGARNEQTAKLLQKQFADRKTKKTYVAVLSGIPKEPVARIDIPIGRNPAAPSMFRVDAKGKPAVTDYMLLAANDQESLVKLRPHTGRTHQLRVHMAHLGTPILGDRVYGKADERLFLHAYQLEITIPSGDRRVFEAPLPAGFSSRFSEQEIAL